MVNPKRTIAELKELRALTSDDNGAQRVAWTDTWLKAREWLTSKLAGLQLETDRYDAAGNRHMIKHGGWHGQLWIGGHLDSVPNGGWLDGSLGVLAGLEVMRAFIAKYGRHLPCPIRLIDFADEEGARFGRSLLGSSAVAGTHTIEADRGRTDKDGVRLEDALRHCGVEIDRFPEAEKERQYASAYIELHIEQGPVLEHLGLPLAAVLGTKGVERHTVTFHGQEAHSGSTPMNARRDALAAAAKLALEIRNIARQHSDSVCTIGSLKTFPGIVTAVVGRAEATLDQRDLDAGVLATMHQAAREASERVAGEERCTVDWNRIWNIEPVRFHPKLIEFCEQAIKETVGTTHRMPSGPLHDAAEVSRSGIPTVMMFVQSLQGISHNKIEDTKEEHLEAAVEAFYKLAEKAANWIVEQG
jgi:beta-ureidopropionase / N-carbamoyl-L-amino-acid hydrolase